MPSTGGRSRRRGGGRVSFDTLESLAAFRLRFQAYPHRPTGWGASGHARCRCPGVVFVGRWRAGADGGIDRRAVRCDRRGTGSLRAERCSPGTARDPQPSRRRAQAGGDGIGVAALVREPAAWDRVARYRRAQRTGAEAPRPCPHGSDRSCRHDLAARGDRRRAQLGLPLLLGAGRCLHAGRAAPPRLCRRGGCLLLVAHAGIPADPPALAGALPPRWRSRGT